MSAANRNLLWAQILIDELSRSGLEAVCIAPGSRSTPLVVACSQHPRIKVYSHLDERSAAFFALGLAMASKKPAAVICTSGTAAANFFPAVIEAFESQIPLLVITADRSHELRNSGANQTIDQVKLYGDNALWSVEVVPPESDPPSLVLRSLRTLACRAYATANGLRKGPVHLNIPFRKPLEPTLTADRTEILGDALPRPDGRPFTTFARGSMQPPYEQITALREIIEQYDRGLIVCGPHTPAPPAVIDQFSRWSGYPVVADAVSGIRFGSAAALLGSYDTRSLEFADPAVVIRLGGVPTSNALNTYLSKLLPAANIAINESGEWFDDNHSLTHFIQADLSALVGHLVADELLRDKRMPLDEIRDAEEVFWAAASEEIKASAYFDGAVLHDVVDLLPAESALFVGNSLPVRHLDQFGPPTGKRLHVYANRGASGIDGVISSALGVGAAHPERPLTLVIGDVSFYHDMNGLLAIRRCGAPMTLVLLNNNGGGIFHRLPIKDFDPPFMDLFVTPHGLDFSHAAHLYGLDYVRADERDSLRQAFAASLGSGQATLIEVQTNAQQDLERRREWAERVKRAAAAKVTSFSRM